MPSASSGSGQAPAINAAPFCCLSIGLATSLLGFLGLWMLLRNQAHSLVMLFFLPLVLFPLPYYITHAEFRFRIVIDPVLTILAAYAISQLLSRPQRPAGAVQQITSEELISA